MGRVKKGTSLGKIYLWNVLAAIAAMGLCAVLLFCIFGVMMNMGKIYPANYAESGVNSASAKIEKADKFSKDMVPELCRYVFFDKSGKVLEGDVPSEYNKTAWKVVQARSHASDKYFYKAIRRADGYVVLQYQLTPQYSSAAWREKMPNPQNLMTIVGAVLLVGIMLADAAIFGKRMRKKMVPLMDAVEKTKEQDLDYAVSYSGVKEVDDVIASMDDMRTALKGSLETQWNAEQEKNRQMSALAHDIKTPLTVVRGNTELLAETSLNEEQKEYAEYISSAAMQIQSYVQTLIEVTKSQDGAPFKKTKLESAALLRDIKEQSLGLAAAYGQKLEWAEENVPAEINAAYDQMVRAVMNIVSNAAEHTPDSGTVSVRASANEGILTFKVEDSGSGFTKDALKHGTEQFFMDDSSRTQGMHYGIGLFTAKTIAEKHGGSIRLGSSEKYGGAEVEISFCMV